MTLSITMLCHYDKCHYAEGRVLFIVMLHVVMLSIVAPSKHVFSSVSHFDTGLIFVGKAKSLPS